MHRAIGLFNGDLRHVAGGSQHEIGMLDAILATVRHANDERLKRNRTEQVANTLFHFTKGSTRGEGVSTDGRRAPADQARAPANQARAAWAAARRATGTRKGEQLT